MLHWSEQKHLKAKSFSVCECSSDGFRQTSEGSRGVLLFITNLSRQQNFIIGLIANHKKTEGTEKKIWNKRVKNESERVPKKRRQKYWDPLHCLLLILKNVFSITTNYIF